MDKKKILEGLFDKKLITVLRLFINNGGEQYYLREIEKLTKVPATTVYRILGVMKELELINETKVKHLKTYKLNVDNASFLINLLEDKTSALQEFIDLIKHMDGIEQVVLHGKEEKDKASILIIGDYVDQESLRTKIVEIKEKYDFNIIHLVLSADQYDQMQSMGLYPGKKVNLFKKA